jgi:hypothetical protein
VSTLVFLVEQTAIGLYILIAIGIFWYWHKWVNARRAYRATTFELERDITRYEIGGALTTMVLLVEIGLVVIGIQRVVAPTVRADREVLDQAETVQGFEDGVFSSPTPPPIKSYIPPQNPGEFDFGGQPELQIRITPTLTPTHVGTLRPAPTPIGCNDSTLSCKCRQWYGCFPTNPCQRLSLRG